MMTRKTIVVPCIVKMRLYWSALTMLPSGVASCRRRISSASMPPTRKNRNDVTPYRMPMRLWSTVVEPAPDAVMTASRQACPPQRFGEAGSSRLRIRSPSRYSPLSAATVSSEVRIRDALRAGRHLAAPGVEVLLALRDHSQLHLGVTDAAELAALTRERAGMVGFEPHDVGVARDGVPRPREPRHAKAVVHVKRIRA